MCFTEEGSGSSSSSSKRPSPVLEDQGPSSKRQRQCQSASATVLPPPPASPEPEAASAADGLITIRLSEDEEGYNALRNADIIGDGLEVDSGDLTASASFITPSGLRWERALPGVRWANFFNTGDAKYALLKIAGRTVKPLEMTLNHRFVSELRAAFFSE
jgi:hypothetical protein